MGGEAVSLWPDKYYKGWKAVNSTCSIAAAARRTFFFLKQLSSVQLVVIRALTDNKSFKNFNLKELKNTQVSLMKCVFTMKGCEY